MPEAATQLTRAVGEHTLTDSSGAAVSSGPAEFRLYADRVQIAPRSQAPFDVEFLDVDAVSSAGYRIDLALWPEGRLLVEKLGRQQESFGSELLDARDEAVLHGALAHGLSERSRFDGALIDGDETVAASLRIYPTHLAAMPRGGLPRQIPWGSLEEISFQPDSYTVAFRSPADGLRVGKLARKTEAFRLACEEARRQQQERVVLAVRPQLPPLSPIASRRLTGAFQDGLGVAQSVLEAAAPGSFRGFIDRVAEGKRLERAASLLDRSRPGEARLGVVELLDIGERAGAAGDDEIGSEEGPTPLGENLAAFLLVPFSDAPVVALELLAGPSAATYLFRLAADDQSAAIAAINSDLQAIHFRRAVLALTEAQAAGPAGRPYRLALRAVPAIGRLRRAILARITHGAQDFGAAVSAALAKAAVS
jgi:hypothetical protein